MLEFRPESLRFNVGETMQEDLLVNGVCEFRAIERSDQDLVAESHAQVCLLRVRVGDVAGYQEARIDIGFQ